MAFSNHGQICSCLGPIIDAQMKWKVFYKEKFMIIQIRPVLLVLGLPIARLMRDVFFPSLYDALLVLRPSCHFRDGTVIKNYTANFRQYFIELPFNDGYLTALIHLIPANYRSRLHTFYTSMCKDNSTAGDSCQRDIILGFAAVFLFIKSYASCLVGELSQLCYKGVLRTIALGSTDALCTWRCTFVMGLEPVIVPVGRIALGRIFNVVGSIIDPYMELSLSSQFNTRIPIDLAPFVESHQNLTYTLSYPNHIFIVLSQAVICLTSLKMCDILGLPRFKWVLSYTYWGLNEPVYHTDTLIIESLPENYHPNSRWFYFWNTMIINTHKFGIFAGDWIFYIALEYMYQTQRIFSHLPLSWTPVYIPYLIWDYSMLAFHLSSIDCSINAFPLACESLFFHTDTLFASVKPIHKTPLAIITLRI